jgi:deoxyadenosine/deoxycytidine kinase
MTKPFSIIAFEGPLKAGKTKIAQRVADALQGELILDVAENPFLDAFYQNKTGAAFQTQLYFLLNRHQLLRDLAQPNLFYHLKICDFIYPKDRIYAYLNLSDSELMLYEKLYNTLPSPTFPPDLVVYLQVSPAAIKDQLRRQKDNPASACKEEYLLSLVEAYNSFFFSHYKSSPVLVVKADRLQFLHDPKRFNEFLQELVTPQSGLKYINPTESFP